MYSPREDIEALIREKYDGDRSHDVTDDLARLASGEPLAYVIGFIPFLGLRIALDSHPLIPRPETEWWTEKLIEHLRSRFDDGRFAFLDLCAGSGVIGLAVLKHFPMAQVTFSELMPEHAALIQKNIEENDLDSSRATICVGDLFAPLEDRRFEIIATNPPYIPETRQLGESVTRFEPAEALYAGADGLSLIRTIAREARAHLYEAGELWMECDIDNIDESKRLLESAGASVTIQVDQYGRPRLVVGYFGE